jgi:tetratricopeptide (TPR) repeat protein
MATTMPAEAQSKRENTKQIDRIVALCKDNRFSEVDFVIDSMLRLYPQNSDMLYLKATRHSQREEYDKAIEYYTEAIENISRKSYYDKAFLLFCRGEVYPYVYKLDAAIEDLTQALEFINKSNGWLVTEILSSRARCYYFNKEYDKAEKDLMTILVSTDNEEDLQATTGHLCDVYIDSKQYQKAILAAEGLLDMECNQLKAYYTLAHANLAMGNLHESIDYVIIVTLFDIKYIDIEELKWMLWHDVEYAREMLHTLIAEDVNNERILQHLFIAEALHDYEAMLPLIDEFSKNYDVKQGLWWLIEYSAKAGKYNEAALYITTLMEGVEGSELYFLTDGRWGYYCLAGEYDKALADANQIVKLMPERAHGYYSRGLIYELMGDDTKAMENYNEGIKVDDNYAYIYLKRGEQYLKAGDKESAKRDFERVLELDTEATDSSCRHYALHFLGRDNEAIEWMESIISNDIWNAKSYYGAACLYAQMGDINQSLYNFHLALYFGYKAKAHIENDEDLDPIRHTEAYQRLMEDYFN